MKREEYLDNHNVFSGDFIWEPIGNQKSTLKRNPPKVLLEKVLLLQLEEN